MIDDPAQVTPLIEKMKAELPIPALATHQIVGTASMKNKSSAKVPVQITDVLYFGDEGGIVCALKVPDLTNRALIVSLTHLSLPGTHPLTPEIRTYQMARRKRLAQQR